MARSVPTSTIPPRHVPACHGSLSLKLYQVMEDIDATIENRQNSIEASTFSDVLGTIAHQPRFTWNTFGSAYEGSTTSDMGSDVDSVLVYQDWLSVVQDCATAPSGNSLLLIQDEATPAGYAKLQLINDGVPLFSRDNYRVELADNVFKKSIDRSNRIILSQNLPYLAEISVFRPKRHGPALSVDPNRQQLAKDIVFALSCDSWPACAAEWLTRQRLFDWPPSDALETCKTLGCLLVSISHQLSEEEHMQWRVSLSYQERLLISLFNSVQLKVFILLKMMKKDHIEKSVTKESLSSYHIKTCMLYMIENTPRDFWKPENLLVCLIRCLQMIQVWVQDGICPNYFIPSENMFESRVLGDVRKKLQQVLHQLLSADCNFLLSIQTSYVGERLKVACSPFPDKVFPPFDDELGRNIPRIGKLKLCCNISLYILHCRNAILRKGVALKEPVIAALFDKVSQLKNTGRITVYTQEETKKVVSHVLPYIELSLMSNIVGEAVEEKKNADTIWRFLTSGSWAEMGAVSDAFTAKIKLATLMYMCGYYQSSIDMLKLLEGRTSFAVCQCYEEEKTPDLQTLLHATKENPNISVEYFIKNLMKPCIVFLPSERNLVPLPLQYEMRRSEGSPQGSRHENIHFWYDWAVVDPKMLLYLLLYLNNKQLNRTKDAADCLKTVDSTREDIEMSHPETNLNLIGWMYKDSGDMDKAGDRFFMSLLMKRYHNAARLHVDDLKAVSNTLVRFPNVEHSGIQIYCRHFTPETT